MGRPLQDKFLRVWNRFSWLKIITTVGLLCRN